MHYLLVYQVKDVSDTNFFKWFFVCFLFVFLTWLLTVLFLIGSFGAGKVLARDQSIFLDRQITPCYSLDGQNAEI